MSFCIKSAGFLARLSIVGSLLATSAQALPVVTYSWTTTSQGFGPHLDQPTIATFDVPLASVLAGVINYVDISNIHVTYPGITLNSFQTSSIGFDNAAYVNTATGAFIFNNPNQGLDIFASDASDPNFSTFVSITVDNAVGSNVKDQYNALNHGAPYAGFPTAGFWTASFPTVTDPAPEAATWMMMVAGFGMAGFAMRRRRKIGVRLSYADGLIA